jgi:hypothetical protein
MTTDYKWGGQPQSVTVAFFHSQIRELVAERFAATGGAGKKRCGTRSSS